MTLKVMGIEGKELDSPSGFTAHVMEGISVGKLSSKVVYILCN